MTIHSLALKIIAKIKYTIFNSFLFSDTNEICYSSPLTDSDNGSLIFSGASEICYSSSLMDLFSIDSDGTNEN